MLIFVGAELESVTLAMTWLLFWGSRRVCLENVDFTFLIRLIPWVVFLNQVIQFYL